MENATRRKRPVSRRSFLAGTGILVTEGALGFGAGPASGAAPTAGTAPPLPWKWAELDPMEAGSLAYRYYFDIGS